MPRPMLHYMHDPLCGWCYAAAPMVDALRAAGVALSLHGGGLWASPTRLAAEKAAYIRESDARIAAMTGQRFGEAYRDGLLGDAATVFWSQPTIAAVLAAGTVATGADLAMLHAIQQAHYVAGLRVVDVGVLTGLAEGIGLDAKAFEAAFDLDAAAGHIRRTGDLMQRLGLRGYPSFALWTGADLLRIPHEGFYARPAAFAGAVADAAQRRVA